MADRISLSNDWFKRGVQLLDEYDHRQEERTLFESYIYLWIALTVAAKEYCACDGKILIMILGKRQPIKMRFYIGQWSVGEMQFYRC